jgi:hypothetical protein
MQPPEAVQTPSPLQATAGTPKSSREAQCARSSKAHTQPPESPPWKKQHDSLASVARERL